MKDFEIEKLKAGILLIAFLFSFKYSYGIGEDPVLSSLTAYNRLIENHHPEKIHIHINQPVYQNRDTIWFKAYIINSFYSRPSAMSKMLSVELVSSSGDLVYRLKLRSDAGLASGHIALSDSIPSGTYHLRAFTPAMQNFGPAFYYDRSVLVRHRSERPAEPALTAASSIQFFPEGGDLIAGIRTKIAFKAVARGGRGIDMSGSITDDSGELISHFKSEHLGMGVFAMTASPGTNYYAKVRFQDGTELKQLIPPAKSQGYMISVNSSFDSIRVRVQCSAYLAGKGLLTLVGMQDGINRYVSQFGLKAEIQNTVWIPKELFNSGAVQFTLFDSDNNPVSERLTFIKKNDELMIRSALKSQYAKREAVNLLLEMENQAGLKDVGNLSVTVYNESEIPGDDDEISIFSDLLLTGDLKGFIESPGYYFNGPENEIRARHLDHLLLTQGWRRFSWKNALSKGFPQIAQDRAKGLEVNGRMTLPSGKPFANGEVSLFKSGWPPMVLQTKTDLAGEFRFSDLDLQDTASFLISANNARYRKNMKIDLFNKKYENAPLTIFYPVASLVKVRSTPENHRLNQLQYRENGILLDAVEIHSKKITKVTESANLNGPGNADVVLTSEDIGFYQDLALFLTSRVAGLSLNRGEVYSRGGKRPMLTIVNGMTLPMSFINIDDIATIEVLKGAASTAIYGIQGMDGILVITTKKGGDHTEENAARMRTPGILPFRLTGYQSSREFYSPKYDVLNPDAVVVPDLRKAVYWNPSVSIGLAEKTEVRYFNSDYTGTYKVVIEGINADGHIGRAVYRYQVK